ncbi:MAG: aminoacyl-histidine dipeptidase [Desulfobacteraceae bacterium]|nr:aminoacyl-histidine dipeptidase [Desulfobacteraceae bacterium]
MKLMCKKLISSLTVSLLLVALPCLASDNPANQKTDEQTRVILDFLKKVNQIPRCSKNEGAIGQWIIKWAKDKGYATQKDESGNILVNIPATPGYEKAPIIVLQGHLDMVCEKTPDSAHDFSSDPIELVYDGEWIKADKTTLGADNGIGVATALAIDNSKAHPPLEVLFTVDEESGLTGANALKPEFLKGKIYINIDSEGEGVITVGSAGGKVSVLTLPLTSKTLPQGFIPCKIHVHKLSGGHSGVDISENRANANKVLAKALDAAAGLSDVRLISIKGGTRSNAIPRDAEAVIAVKSEDAEKVKKGVDEFTKKIKKEFASTDKTFTIDFTMPDEKAGSAYTRKDTDKTVKLLLALPNGVYGMSDDFEGLVETSNNIGVVKIEKDVLAIKSLQRGSIPLSLEKLTKKIEETAVKIGAKPDMVFEFSGWEPNMKSALLQRGKTVYKSVFNKEAKVHAVHGGLECSVIGKIFPGMDMIAIGPTIENAHSPDERLHVPSVTRFWKFLTAILESYKP